MINLLNALKLNISGMPRFSKRGGVVGAFMISMLSQGGSLWCI